jgi:hypothetical protein
MTWEADAAAVIRGFKAENDALAARLAKAERERWMLLECLRGGVYAAPCPTPRQWGEIQEMVGKLLRATDSSVAP